MSKAKKVCSSKEEEFELRRGPWTIEEDNLLIHYITCNGEGRWNLLAKCAGLKRRGKSCRLRWLNYLKPDIKRGNLTPQEQILILQLHAKLGNRWSKIAQHLPGRTDNEIKNYWRTRVEKQARKLKIDSNSKRFIEELKKFWMPRLLDKMEQNSSSFSSVSTKESHDSTQFSQQPNKLLMINLNNIKEKSISKACSSESTKIIQMPQDPNKVVSVDKSLGSVYTSSLPSECYYVGNCSFVMEEGFDQIDASSVGLCDFPMSDRQMADFDLVNDDMAGTFWSMDELW